MQDDATISNYFLRAVMRNLVKRGGQSELVFLARAGISPRLYSESDSRVTTERYALLQMLVMRELDDEMLGYSSRPLRIGSWSAMCSWAINSKNVGHAIKRISHFYRILEKGMRVSSSVKQGVVAIEFSPWKRNEVVQPYAYELFIFSIHRFLCWLINRALPVSQVNLNYSRPKHAYEYRALFPRSECKFDRDVCSLELPLDALDLPISQTPDTLRLFLQKPTLNVLINDYNQSSWTSRTKILLAEQLTTLPTLVELSQQLSLHPATLRRHLEREGISYSALKSHVRRDIAIKHLSKTDQSVEDIALLVGFSEACTFSRAFKSWTGLSPNTYRKKHHHFHEIK